MNNLSMKPTTHVKSKCPGGATTPVVARFARRIKKSKISEPVPPIEKGVQTQIHAGL